MMWRRLLGGGKGCGGGLGLGLGLGCILDSGLAMWCLAYGNGVCVAGVVSVAEG